MAGPSPLLLAPLGIFGALALTMGLQSMMSDAPVVGAGAIDRPLPEVDLPPLPGRSDDGLNGDDIAGKVVVLNVFASWCAACREEHPLLLDLATRPDVPPILGVNWRDDPGAGELYLRRHGNPYLAAGDDRAGTLGRELNVTGVPETYVIDAEGRMRYRHIGPVTDRVWNETLAPLIAELRETP